MTNRQLIKDELSGLYGESVLQDMGEIISLYDFYDGKGQKWPLPAGLDYIPTRKRTNIVKKLIKSEARFMFGRTPEIHIRPMHSQDSHIALEVQRAIDDTLEKCSFGDRLLKAARDCFIGKRVAIRLRLDNDNNADVCFLPSPEFVFEPMEDDPSQLKKIIFFYQINDEDSPRNQRIFKQKLEMIDGKCYITEGFYNGYGELVESKYDLKDTGLDFIPARVIINDGLTGDLIGESDVAELMDNQTIYNRLTSDDIDALRFNMFPQRVAVDSSSQSLKNMVAAPGALIDLQTDPAAMSGQASLKMLEPSFGYDERLEHTLTRIKSDMYEIISVPNVSVDQLKGVVNSGKGLRTLYWELISRCEEKWAVWEPALKWMVRSLIKLLIQAGKIPQIDFDYKISIEHLYPLFEDEEEERLKDLQEVKENVRSRSAYIEKWDIAPDSQDELGKINEEQSDIIQQSHTQNDDIDNIPVANEQS